MMKYWGVTNEKEDSTILFYTRNDANDYVYELAKLDPEVQADYIQCVKAGIVFGDDNLTFHEFIRNTLAKDEFLHQWGYRIELVPLYFSSDEALLDA